MSMSKKHYIKFAELLKKHSGKLPSNFTMEFMEILEADNERFDWNRFCEAAGVP